MKKQLVHSLIAATLVTTSPAVKSDIINLNFDGFFTMMYASNSLVQNTSYPYFGDATWGYGKRTQITGSMIYDTSNGVGTGTISEFSWMDATMWVTHDLNLQAVGDGSGGAGNLIKGDMLYDAYGLFDIPLSVIWDASGFLNTSAYTVGQTIANTGATPASDAVASLGSYQIGSSPFATTTLDSVLPLSDDGIGGIPLTSGPFKDFSPNIDVTSMTVISVSTVPVPAAVWLFGSGLIGLFGFARRRKS